MPGAASVGAILGLVTDAANSLLAIHADRPTMGSIAARGEGPPAMAEIANAIGRTTCVVIGSLVRQCQTGEPVANVGYGAAALIILVCGVVAFLNRPA
jgi:hypothetical protein